MWTSCHNDLHHHTLKMIFVKRVNKTKLLYSYMYVAMKARIIDHGWNLHCYNQMVLVNHMQLAIHHHRFYHSQGMRLGESDFMMRAAAIVSWIWLWLSLLTQENNIFKKLWLLDLSIHVHSGAHAHLVYILFREYWYTCISIKHYCMSQLHVLAISLSNY